MAVVLMTAVAVALVAAKPAKVKLGFLVKMPEEPWFQNEWKFADSAARVHGFDLVKIGATDGEKVLAAIDNLAAQGALGFVICTPDVRLGPAIVTKAKVNKMKVFSVDDRFLGSNGAPIEEVPYMGISAYKIGQTVGQALIDESKKRGWKLSETGAISVSYSELPTCADRNRGAIEVLVKNGFDQKMVFDAPEKTNDTEGGFNAASIVIIKNPTIKHWLAFACNDEGVLGAVRALEGRGFTAAKVIGVGIGGTKTAAVEFAKKEPTGFFATVKLDPWRHGFETAEMLYRWVVDGTEPAKATFTSGTLVDRTNYKSLLKE